MTVSLTNKQASAALRAASKSGYKDLVEDLLKLGVKASEMDGIAAKIAEYYGHAEVASLLEQAIRKEKRTN